MAKRNAVAGTASDPVVEFAKVEIDGETYRLAYDFNAIAEAEKLADANLLHGIAGLLGKGANAAQIRGLLYAALRKAHPKLTLAQAGALIRIDTIPDIYDAIEAAYRLSLPEAKKHLLGPLPGGVGAGQDRPDPPSPIENSGSDAGPPPASPSD